MFKTKLLAAAAGLALAASVQAASIPTIEPGPLYIKATGFEQIAAGDLITAPTGGYSLPASLPTQENSWGVFRITDIAGGILPAPANQLFNRDGGNVQYSDSQGATAGYITGMFYGLHQTTPPAGSAIASTGGYIDLWWNAALPSSSPTAGDRTGYNTFTGYTGGTFLVRLMFASGIAPLDSSVTVTGSVAPTDSNLLGGLTGFADAYLNVDTSVTGLWTTMLDTDFFNTAFGTRDMRLKNSYNLTDGFGADTQRGVFGATLDDPIRAAAIPEPGVLALLGMGLLGFGFSRRRNAS